RAIAASFVEHVEIGSGDEDSALRAQDDEPLNGRIGFDRRKMALQFFKRRAIQDIRCKVGAVENQQTNRALLSGLFNDLPLNQVLAHEVCLSSTRAAPCPPPT